jgi:hypothetical protein
MIEPRTKVSIWLEDRKTGARLQADGDTVLFRELLDLLRPEAKGLSMAGPGADNAQPSDAGR